MAGRTLTLGRDLAIDLGTANVLVHARGRGVVVDEPSVVTLEVPSGRIGRVCDEDTSNQT